MTDEAIFEFGAEHDDDTYTIFFPDGHNITAWASGRLVVTKVEKNFRPFEVNVSELRDRIATQQEAIDELVEHIREQTEHFKVRIEDGKQLGATVWRLALEDMVRENAAFLAREKKDGRMDEKQARIFAAIDELETLLHVEKRLPDRKFAEVAERFDVPLPMLLEQWRVS